jgi:hypothetical protein
MQESGKVRAQLEATNVEVAHFKASLADYGLSWLGECTRSEGSDGHPARHPGIAKVMSTLEMAAWRAA